MTRYIPTCIETDNGFIDGGEWDIQELITALNKIVPDSLFNDWVVIDGPDTERGV